MTGIVDKAYGVDEQEPDAAGHWNTPFGDDGKRDDRSELQARYRDHGDERVFHGMAEIDCFLAKAAGPGKADIVRSQNLKHFRAHETHDQCHLVKPERNGRQDHRLEAVSRSGWPNQRQKGFVFRRARMRVASRD